ncbi:MAG: molybdenum cofactor biosynthesis protein MoaE [Acidobacteriota bacterium]
MIRMVESRIERDQIVNRVAAPESGAIVTFDGTVRNEARGKEVTHLSYEAYSAMAIREMEKIRARAMRQWPITEMTIVHRLGRLEIGETSVFIAVSSAHRSDAFEACRFAIDTLKSTVPIWKKEYYQDGECWIEGYAG